MEIYFKNLLWLLLPSGAAFFLFKPPISVAVDTITALQAIEDGETIVSDGETYELGFFSPGKSKKRYLGIWYKKVSAGPVVWLANRETPITDSSGMLTVTREGDLQVSIGGYTVIWSSNSSASIRTGSPVAQLLDTGNLLVWDGNSTDHRNLSWQSFDYQGDTLLPGMKLGKDLATGLEWVWTSWESPDDPSPGKYSNIVDPNGYPQIFGRQGDGLLQRLGPWNGFGFSGFPNDIPNTVYSLEFVVNRTHIYLKYETKSSVVQRYRESS